MLLKKIILILLKKLLKNKKSIKEYIIKQIDFNRYNHVPLSPLHASIYNLKIFKYFLLNFTEDSFYCISLPENVYFSVIHKIYFEYYNDGDTDLSYNKANPFFNYIYKNYKSQWYKIINLFPKKDDSFYYLQHNLFLFKLFINLNINIHTKYSLNKLKYIKTVNHYKNLIYLCYSLKKFPRELIILIAEKMSWFSYYLDYDYDYN